MIMNPVIFREYDIRGVYEKEYDLSFTKKLGLAYVHFLKTKRNVPHPTITIGYDARLSSPEIKETLCQGIRDAGGNVIELGLVTTPICYFSTFNLENVDGSIMITGSHNPPEYNGFKISAGKTTIFGEDIQELRRIIENNSFSEAKTRGSQKEFDIFPSYILRYTQEFQNLKKIKVVLDLGNGTAGCIARRLYNACGLDPVILFEEPDGNFPNHHPDPTIEENLTALKQKVIETQADLGIGFDGDSDRIGIVDNNGKMVMGDELIYLFALSILKDKPGEKVIADVKCSDRMYDSINKIGGQAIMWKTGHSVIKEKVREEEAAFGGELSGHIFFLDRNYGYDDALYAGLRIIEILSKTDESIEDMVKQMGHGYCTPEIRIETTEEKKKSIVEKIKSIYKSNTNERTVNHIDGVRISYKDGWALVRSSNTQPVLVLRFESKTSEGLEKIQSEFEKIISPLLNETA